MEVYNNKTGQIEELADNAPAPDEVGYTDWGAVVPVTVEKCYCKQVGQLYFVKVGQKGTLFDAWGPLSEGTSGQKRDGRTSYEFRRVTKPVFDSYLRFLQTKNSAHLLRAQREYNNGAK